MHFSPQDYDINQGVKQPAHIHSTHRAPSFLRSFSCRLKAVPSPAPILDCRNPCTTAAPIDLFSFVSVSSAHPSGHENPHSNFLGLTRHTSRADASRNGPSAVPASSLRDCRTAYTRRQRRERKVIYGRVDRRHVRRYDSKGDMVCPLYEASSS